MPDRQDDPFGDLDAGPRGTRAGDKLAELDERAPEPTPPQPRRPRGRYTWVVGVAAVIAIIVAGVNSLPHAGRGSRGLPAGTRLRVFAAPAVPGPIDKPANVNQSARDPAVGKTAACSVNPAGAVKLCPPFGRPVVITFIVPVGDCEDYVSRLERLRSAFPQVRFITVISTVKQKGASQLVRDRGWREEVALDENGSLLNLYRVSLCATSVFARRGGVVASTKVEAQRWAPAQLRVAVAAVGR